MATRNKLVRPRFEAARPVAHNRESGDHPLLELVTGETHDRQKLAGVLIGRLEGLGDAGEPLVEFAANRLRRPLPARSIAALGADDVGREVVLMFEENDLEKPIVMGVINQPPTMRSAPAEDRVTERKTPEVELDGERLLLTAQKEIVLRCGKATITLTRAGKVLIRGAYLLNRSSGVNRIKGGSVQIN
jgi:hypothetical protein